MHLNITAKHNWKRRAAAGISALTLLVCSLQAQDSIPTREEMWAVIQQQQAEIAALKERVGLTETKVAETESAVEIAGAQIDATASYVESFESRSPASGGSALERTHLGGYGELHLNLGKKDQIDFHRWVLFLGHDFNERVRFFSELEVEHSIAGEGKAGEVELEQAYVEFDLNENDSLKAGLFLLPVGILNETHEPNTFYGVERNGVESNVIPSTWWEGGVAYRHQNPNGWALDLAAHSGLYVPTSGSKAFNIRSGRQKVGSAEASDGAVTTRLTYTGLPGVTFGFSAQYQQDLAQGMLAETADATLLSAHTDLRRGNFGFRALYARWDIGGASAAAIGADEQFGYYFEPSYRFETEHGDVGFFARYSTYDIRANSATSTEDSFFDIGMNYWPLDNVVFKWDVQFTDPANGGDEEIINLGVGYQF